MLAREQASPLKPRIIGISGPTCAGKTVLARELAQRLSSQDAVVIELDSYYRDLSLLTPDELKNWNFDRPDSLDSELLIEQILRLASGFSIEKPVYQFPAHKRSPVAQIIEPRPIIIVEGLFALYWEELRNLYSKRIFIDLPESQCLSRRIYRDAKERGFEPEFIINQFHSTVKPMYEKFIHPTRNFADIILNGESGVSVSAEKIVSSL